MVKYVKRSNIRKRRFTKKSRSKYSRGVKLSVYKRPLFVKRTCLLDTVVLQNSGGRGYNFQLSQLPNYSEFTSLFDRYRISGVKLKIIPTCDNNATGTSATYNAPRLYYCWDYDDSDAPITANQMMERDNVKIKQGLRVISTYSKPRAQMAIFNTGLSTAYGDAQRKQWIDMGNTSVPHYGFKCWFESDSASTLVNTYKIYATMYLQLKNII